MNADKVEHRGIEAHQGVYNDVVKLIKGGKTVATIRTTRRQTADELKAIIDKYLEGGERDVSSVKD